MIFRQLFDRNSCTYTYLLGCSETKEAILIDPVFEFVSRDTKLLNELGLKLKYTCETHMHADHVAGGLELRKTHKNEIIASKNAKASFDGLIEVKDGDVIKFGKESIRVMDTPGHTSCSVSFVYKDKWIFTGDALFVRGCGRSDFQAGDPSILYDSIHKIFKLPKDCIVYPGHDYNGHLYTTVGEEIKYNPRIGNGQTREGFVKIMNGLNLSFPPLLALMVPSNVKGGLKVGPQPVALLDQKVYVSAVLEENEIAFLKSKGVKTYVQLRKTSEPGWSSDELKALVEKNGMKYAHYPIDGEEIPKVDLDKVVDDLNKIVGDVPFNIACASANRSRALACALVSVYGDKYKGIDLVEEASKIPVKSVKDAIFNYIYSKKKK